MTQQVDEGNLPGPQACDGDGKRRDQRDAGDAHHEVSQGNVDPEGRQGGSPESDEGQHEEQAEDGDLQQQDRGSSACGAEELEILVARKAQLPQPLASWAGGVVDR